MFGQDKLDVFHSTSLKVAVLVWGVELKRDLFQDPQVKRQSSMPGHVHTLQV